MQDFSMRSKNQILLSSKSHSKSVHELFWSYGNDHLFSVGKDCKIVRYDVNKLNDMDDDYKFV